MANLRAIYSVGNSLISYLQSEYDQLRSPLGQVDPTIPDCQFQLISSSGLDQFGDDSTTLSLFLYRVIMNEHLRSANRSNVSFKQGVPLSIDLHYLMTVWTSAESVFDEQFIFAWAIRQLHLHPVFDSSILTEAGWRPEEVVHIVPAELTNEDMMRIWDSLQPSYHLSKAYIARAIRIDSDVEQGTQLPVVSTRFLSGNLAAIQELQA